MFFNINKLIEKVNEKNRIFRLTVLFWGAFLLALNYNMYLKPNNLVTGGTTGLAIILQTLTKVDANIYIYIFSILLIIISFFTLGVKETSKSALGSIIYPLFVTLTAPLAQILNEHLVLDSIYLEVLVSALIMGFASGIIYKVGYNTGGNDIIVAIMNKYAKIPIGKSGFISNVIIILLGGAIFGVNNVLYAIVIVYINSVLVDKILIGISSSKQFFIHTKQTHKIKELIIKKLGAGVTVLETTGGYTQHKGKMLMCVVPNRDYYLFKELVLEIDPQAFFIINDCYEVAGGVKKPTLPFL